MKRMSIVVAILSASQPAFATDSLYIDVNGFSLHSKQYYSYQGERKEYNQDNAGLGLSKQWNDNADLTAGFYKNSYDKMSAYGGANAHLNFKSGSVSWRPGVCVGLVTGYDNTPDHAGVVRLMVMPNVAISVGDLGIKVGYLPARKASRSTVVYNSTLDKDGNIYTSTTISKTDDVNPSVLTVQFQYRIK